MSIYVIVLSVVVVVMAIAIGWCLESLKTEREAKNQQILETRQLELGLHVEVEKYKKLLSQKKSSETRLGQISENLVPLLAQIPYDSKNLCHLGQPIDYVYFDYDQGEIIFIEVKSGQARESKRQKTIKNLIKTGRVHYEIITINDKGINIKRTENE